jgi:hypothetical protein
VGNNGVLYTKINSKGKLISKKIMRNASSTADDDISGADDLMI